jgi:hypothetical protein
MRGAIPISKEPGYRASTVADLKPTNSIASSAAIVARQQIKPRAILRDPVLSPCWQAWVPRLHRLVGGQACLRMPEPFCARRQFVAYRYRLAVAYQLRARPLNGSPSYHLSVSIHDAIKFPLASGTGERLPLVFKSLLRGR